MITTWFLQRALDWRTYAVLALVAIISTATYKINQHGYNNGVAHQMEQDVLIITALQKQVQIDQDMYAQSILDSSKIQTEWQAKIDKANEDANNARTKLEILRGDNQRLNDSLRSVTSKANQRISLPTTPKADITEYTTTLSDVFEQCTSEYLKLATTATDDSISFKQVIDSYPQSK